MEQIEETANALAGLDGRVYEKVMRLVGNLRRTKKGGESGQFEVMLKRFRKYCVPEVVLEFFEEKEVAILKKAKSYTTFPVPFLLVIPYTVILPGHQMAWLKGVPEWEDRQQSFCKIVYEQKKPYAIFGIEDGRQNLGQSPFETKKTLEKEKRLPLSIEESIALAAHAGVLTHHNLIAFGDSIQYDNAYGNPFYVYPVIEKKVNGPVLRPMWFVRTTNVNDLLREVYSHSTFGVPSCAERMMLE